MKDAILITLDALQEFASNHKLLSTEFDEGATLCDVLISDNDAKWSLSKIRLSINGRNQFFYTTAVDKNHLLVLDRRFLEPLAKHHPSEILMIFQNLVKYAIRRFAGEPLIDRERLIGDNKYLVYPLPFQARRESVRALVYESAYNNEIHVKTVYYCGTEDKKDAGYKNANTNKIVADFLSYELDLSEHQSDNDIALRVTDLDCPEAKEDSLSLEQCIGYDNWQLRLTNPQRRFINAEVTGPERLEGAAGTGKTISLVLKCINILQNKRNADEEYHIIFFTHSKAALEHVNKVFQRNYSDFGVCIESIEERPKVSICITTLQDWCSWQLLGINHIEESEFIDKDASYAKGIQAEYIRESLSLVKGRLGNFITCMGSQGFVQFINSPMTDTMLSMLQHEVSVIIKGKAHGDRETYKALPYIENGIPVQNENDRTFMLAIFDAYQNALKDAGKYDTDDIVISAFGNVSTPILERRRERTGYDLCVIDETQLFNFNELSIFHYANKPQLRNHIIYAIDKSQAIGEWSVTDDELKDFMPVDASTNKLSTMFRCSTDIVRLAFGILTSGVSMFKSFENPMSMISTNLTPSEEKKCSLPSYNLYDNDDIMIEESFHKAELFKKENKVSPDKILIAVTTDELLFKLRQYTESRNKKIEELKSRADAATMIKASQGGKFVVGLIDYVGGLEFEFVILVGVDKDRVPPKENKSTEAQNFINYVWHNRMYVAITRAKYAVQILGSKERGESPLLHGIIEVSSDETKNNR